MEGNLYSFSPFLRRRFGFDALPKPSVDIAIPSLMQMKQMLQREDELRLGDKYQALFANPGAPTHSCSSSFVGNNAIHVAALVQAQVVEEFGYEGQEAEQAISVMRAALAFYPEQKEEICKIPHYLKYNRAAKGKFEVGTSLSSFGRYSCL